MPQERQGVLVDHEIKTAKIIASETCDTCFAPASYDLRVGDQHIDPSKGEQDAALLPLRDKPIVVPPFGSLIVSTHEIVCLPGDAIGKFNLRIKQALRGLFVQMGTQVEPWYHGRLFAVLYNVTSEEIQLCPSKSSGSEDQKGDYRDRLFTIEFFHIGKTVEGEHAKAITDIREFVRTTRFAQSSIGAMGEKITNIESKFGSLQQQIRAEFSTTIEATKAQLDAVDKVKNIREYFDNKQIEQLNSTVQRNSEQIVASRSEFERRFDELGQRRRELWWGLGFGAIGLLFISAVLPFIFSIAIEWANPWSNGDRQEIVRLQSQLSDIADRIDNAGEVTSLNGAVQGLGNEFQSIRTELQEVETRIQELMARYDELSQQVNGDQ